MATNVLKKYNLPKHGFINELAMQAGCDRNTVRRALYENAKGPKSDKVRLLFEQLYEANYMRCLK
jgi:hypothetical protein